MRSFLGPNVILAANTFENCLGMTHEVAPFVEDHGWIDGLLQGLFKFPYSQHSIMGADLHPDLLGDEIKGGEDD